VRAGRQSAPQVARDRAPRTVALKGGKRGLRFRELAELTLQDKEDRGIKGSSLRADRVRLGVLNPLIGHLKISRFKARTFSAKKARRKTMTAAK
jgi:hypothetical protein